LHENDPAVGHHVKQNKKWIVPLRGISFIWNPLFESGAQWLAQMSVSICCIAKQHLIFAYASSINKTRRAINEDSIQAAKNVDLFWLVWRLVRSR